MKNLFFLQEAHSRGISDFEPLTRTMKDRISKNVVNIGKYIYDNHFQEYINYNSITLWVFYYS